MEQRVPTAHGLYEAVGIFPDTTAVEYTVQDLMTAGFDHADISLLAGDDTVRRKLGHCYEDMHAAEDDPCAPREAWIDPESRTEGRAALTGVLSYLGAMAVGGLAFANGGTEAVAIAAAMAGGGALGGLGYGVGRLIDGKLVAIMRSHVEHGGIVLWVKVRNDDHARRACEVLTSHGAADVHVHQLRAPSELQPEHDDGWPAIRFP